VTKTATARSANAINIWLLLVEDCISLACKYWKAEDIAYSNMFCIDIMQLWDIIHNFFTAFTYHIRIIGVRGRLMHWGKSGI
jgi:hypothetical protein